MTDDHLICCLDFAESPEQDCMINFFPKRIGNHDTAIYLAVAIEQTGLSCECDK
jgi:hypothetical protein